MSQEQPKNLLHGLILKAILEDLVARHGWAALGERIAIRCFTHDPGLKSSLTFLRKTEWARTQVEELYLDDQRRGERNRLRNQRRAAMRKHSAKDKSEAQPDSLDDTSLTVEE